jgi:hypothetical protein
VVHVIFAQTSPPSWAEHRERFEAIYVIINGLDGDHIGTPRRRPHPPQTMLQNSSDTKIAAAFIRAARPRPV